MRGQEPDAKDLPEGRTLMMMMNHESTKSLHFAEDLLNIFGLTGMIELGYD